jgi:DNA-binding transcriptional regulator YdaS (Cro superfamily)
MSTRSKILLDDPRRIAMNLAVERAGGPSALARQLGITSHAVSMWPIVPSKRVRAVEKASGVSRYRLRPDVFGNKAETCIPA